MNSKSRKQRIREWVQTVEPKMKDKILADLVDFAIDVEREEYE